MRTETYNILIGGKVVYSDVTEGEYFRIMEDLAIEFYQTGLPNPDDITTELTETING